MKKSLAFVLLASASSLACAAHLGSTSATTSQGSIPSVDSWSGFYVGMLVSHVNSTDQVSSGEDNNFPGVENQTFHKTTYGAVTGYNVQNQHFVYGAEFDFNSNGGKYSYVGTINSARNYTTEVKYSAHARARFGYAIDRVLFYLTGGLAYANTNATAANTTSSTTSNQNRIGGSFGVGMNYIITSNIDGRIEALQDFYNATSYSSRGITANYSSSLRTNTIRGGLTYKFDF